MPQDGDGSALISLLWATWIYWWIYRWLDHVSSLEQHDKESRQRSQSGPVADAGVAIPPTNVRSPGNLEAIISEILRREDVSGLDVFLAKALAAYEAVVVAFNAGDRTTLRTLVSREVYDVFSDAISIQDAREMSRNTETLFSRIEPEIVDGCVGETHMQVSVRFVSDSFRLSRDAAGRVVDGGSNSHRTVDIWTFERMLSSRRSGWDVVATNVDAQ